MNLLKRYNTIIDITLKWYTNKNEEYQNLNANAQIINENINSPSNNVKYTALSRKKIINTFTNAAQELFENLYRIFMAPRDLNVNNVYPVIVPANQMRTVMQLIIKQMIVYLFLLAGLQKTLINAINRAHLEYQTEIEALYSSAFTSINVDRKVDLNYIPLNVNNKGLAKSVKSALDVYKIIYEFVKNSLQNPQFVAIMSEVANYTKQLNSQIVNRTVLNLRKAFPDLKDAPNNPNPELLRDYFMRNDGSNHFLSTNAEDKKLKCLLGYGGSDSSTADDSMTVDCAGDDDDDRYLKSMSESNRNTMTDTLNRLDEDLKQVLAEINNVASDGDMDNNNVHKMQLVECLRSYLDQYVTTIYNIGESIFQEMNIELAPDMLGIHKDVALDNLPELDMMKKIVSGAEEGTEFMTKHIPLVNSIMNKMSYLYSDINRKYNYLEYLESMVSAIKIIYDSHIKNIMKSIHVSETMIYNCMPVSTISILNKLLQQGDIMKKFQSVRDKILANVGTEALLVELNGFTPVTLEELTLLSKPVTGVPGDDFFTNSSLATKYSDFYQKCMEVNYDLMMSASYSIIQILENPPPPAAVPSTTVANQTYVRLAPTTANPKAFEIVALEAKNAPPVKYYKCFTSLVSAAMKTPYGGGGTKKNNLVMTLTHYLNNIEPVLMIELLARVINDETQTSPLMLEILEDMLSYNTYKMDKTATPPAPVEDTTTFPDMLCLVYLRFLVATLVLNNYQNTKMAGDVLTIDIQDSTFAQHLSKLITTKSLFITDILNIYNISITSSGGGITVDFSVKTSNDASVLEVRPEFFTDFASPIEFPDISQYLTIFSSKPKTVTDCQLFPREKDRFTTISAASFQDKMAILASVSQTLNLFNMSKIDTSEGVYTIHKYRHSAKSIVFNIK